MGVELVDQERAAQLARYAHPALQLLTLDDLAGRIAGVGEQQGGEPPSGDLPAELVEAEVVAGLSLEEDGDRGEQLEDVEQLLVRGVVREEMADVLTYLLRLADKLNVDLVEAANKKIEANAKKYPVDKSRGSIRKYTDL